MLVILDVGETAADAFGLLAITVALVNFDSAAFRIAVGSPERDERPHGPSVR